jgi:hypothetical protein
MRGTLGHRAATRLTFGTYLVLNVRLVAAGDGRGPYAAANPDLRRFSSRSLMILSIRP